MRLVPVGHLLQEGEAGAEEGPRQVQFLNFFENIYGADTIADLGTFSGQTAWYDGV